MGLAVINSLASGVSALHIYGKGITFPPNTNKGGWQTGGDSGRSDWLGFGPTHGTRLNLSQIPQGPTKSNSNLNLS